MIIIYEMFRKNVILLGSVLVVVIGAIIFFHQTELEFELICSADIRDDFYPDAYVVINSEKKKRDYFTTNKDTKTLASICIDKIDVSKYSYVVVYGRKVKRMYYSYKTTFFNDKSDYYVKRWGADVLFIEYEPDTDDTPTFNLQG